MQEDNGTQVEALETKLFDNNSRVFFLFKNQDNRFGMFYGNNFNKRNVNNNVTNNQIRDYFAYSYDENYWLEFDQSSKRIKFFGEKIIFKRNERFSKEFFENLFRSIYSCIEKNEYLTLYQSLEDISELLYSSEEDNGFKTLQGYLGEMSFIYYLIVRKSIPNHLELAKSCFDSYQKNQNAHHDINFRPNLHLEIKSTRGESMSFLIREGQQEKNRGTELFYGFVKYSFVNKERGLNLSQLTEEICKKLQVEQLKIPNHLILNSNEKKFQNYYIDPDEIVVYLLSNNFLPDFGKIATDNAISDISYHINIIDYFKGNNPYDENLSFDDLYIKLKAEENKYE